MLEDWQRADVISTAALLVSCAAAAFTWQQMRIARRKEKAEVAASDPTVEVSVHPAEWPGWSKITLTIRNRSDTAVVCRMLSLRRPLRARFATDEDAQAEAGGETPAYASVAKRAAPVSFLRRRINLDFRIPRSGHVSEGTMVLRAAGLVHVGSQDVRHLVILAFSSSTVSARKPVVFRMSLRTERTNASAPYREINVIARVVPVSTSITI